MATFSDDFNRANGAPGSNYNGASGFNIVSNALVDSNSGIDSLATNPLLVTAISGGVDNTANVKFTYSSGKVYAIHIRSLDASNGYQVQHADTTLRIWTMVAGTPSTIASENITVSGGETYRLEAEIAGSAPSVITGRLYRTSDEALIGTVSVSNNNSALQAAGRPGLGSFAGATFDDLNVTTSSTVADTTYDAANRQVLYTPFLWRSQTGATMQTSNCGASTYFRANITGAGGNIRMVVATSMLSGIASAATPLLEYSINGAAESTVVLAYSASNTEITIASDLSIGEYEVRVSFRAVQLGLGDSLGNRWDHSLTTGSSVWRVVSWIVGNGSIMESQQSRRRRRMLWFGDSNSEGAEALTAGAGQPRTAQDATIAAPYILAGLLGDEWEACVDGRSAQGWETGGFGSVPAFPSAWTLYASGASRKSSTLLNFEPDLLLVAHGINGTTTSSTVTSWITAARVACPNSHIGVVVPHTGAARSALTTGVNNYLTGAPGDAKVSLIDAGNLAGADIHMTQAQHTTYATALQPLIEAFIAPPSSGGGRSSLNLSGGYQGVY